MAKRVICNLLLLVRLRQGAPYSLVEQWSARQSVTLEAAGSNPVGAAKNLYKFGRGAV